MSNLILSALFTIKKVCAAPHWLASFPGSCPGEEEERWVHTSRMHQFFLVTCILLHYTKITINFCLTAERPHCIVLLPVGHIRAVLKSQTISLCMVCITSFEAIGELQRDRLCHSCAAAISWNGRMHGQFLEVNSLVPLSLSHHCLHRAWSVVGIFYKGEVGVPPGG